ncbi:MAG: phytoene desaturase family protein [Oryzihumus sp.]
MPATRNESVDAVVIGAGHHGLVTAAVLADAGWDVLVLEARDRVGGAVASVVRDGWVMDEFSACHPLAAASPVLQALALDEVGLQWARSERVLAHVGAPEDTEGALLHQDPARTAAWLAREHPADGDAWLQLVRDYDRVKGPFLEALLTRWPPVGPGARLAGALGRELPRFVRFLTLPVARMGEELFAGQRGRELLAGNAMHADIPPDSAGSGVFGWLMSMLAQDVGFPSPVGGSGRLAEALAERARRCGARIELGETVTGIDVRDGRAGAVTTASGRWVRARRAVVADTSAPALYEQLLPESVVPRRVRDDLRRRFQWDLPTVKLNYRLSAPVPWTASAARGAGVVHVGAGLPGLVRWSADLGGGRVPEQPFALVGQMSTIDPTRSPEGTEALWVYTHLPRGVHDDASADVVAGLTEAMMDRYAPGWQDLVRDRWVQRPGELHAQDANLGQGAVGGGTQQLSQQLVFRPVTGLGGPRTAIEGLYLGSAATHPGGGVHGACGYLAARCALADNRWWGAPRRRLALAALHGIQGAP